MKNFILVFMIIILYSCQSNKGYKYKIVSNHSGQKYIYYTDTIEYKGDTVGYYNTDGSYVPISYKKALDCRIDTFLK